MKFFGKRERLKEQIAAAPDLPCEAGGEIVDLDPVRYAFDDPRRPKPDIAIRFHRIEFNPDGTIELGDLFTIEDFVEMSLHGTVSNWDGHGYYAFVSMNGEHRSIMESNQYAKPDDIRKDLVDRYWTHVVWYNK